MVLLLVLVSSFLPYLTSAAAIIDTNCTEGGKYTKNAVGCDNYYDDASCNILYPSSTVAADGTDERVQACFSPDGKVIDEEVRSIAVNSCPKTCGYCCLTKEFNCANSARPRINCNTITKNMCKDANWREIIAQDCPASCGFCLLGGCIDKAVDCESQPTLCYISDFKAFTTANCQRTCGLCTNNSSNGSSSCDTSKLTDGSTNCAGWKKNGFCESSFYKPADKKKFCAKTCGIC